MAGHSKWANIKHRKARQDAKRGKAWSKCSKAIMAAARAGGGDPDANLALRYAIDEAKSENMPKDTIQNAIDKATGNAEGVHYEQVVYEGYAPAGVAVMLDCLTDNKNRTVPELRKLFEKHGGNLGESGCVAFNFAPHGQVTVDKTTTDEDTLMAIALDHGGEDLVDDADAWRVLCDPSDFDSLHKAIARAGIAITAARGRTMVPGSTITVAGEDAAKVLRLLDALEDHDDVQQVYANLDIPDDQLAALQDA